MSSLKFTGEKECYGGGGGSGAPGTRSTNGEVLTCAPDASIDTDPSATVNLMCKELYTALSNLKSLNDRLAELQGLDREPMHSPIYGIYINPRPDERFKENALEVFLRTDVWFSIYSELRRLNSYESPANWESYYNGHNAYIVSLFKKEVRFYSVVNKRSEHEKARKLDIDLPDWIELKENGGESK